MSLRYDWSCGRFAMLPFGSFRLVQVEWYTSQGAARTCCRPCAFEEIRIYKRQKKRKKSAPPRTHHEIHNRRQTATNSRRRATKRVLRGSPYSRAFSIDPGFVEITLACIHTYPHCCCCAGCFCFLVHHIFSPAQLLLSLL